MKLIIAIFAVLTMQILVSIDANFSRHDNKMLSSGFSFLDIKTGDYSTCIQLCLMYRLCASISYDKNEKQCRLNVQTPDSLTVLLQENKNFISIEKKDIPHISFGCANHMCGQEFACINNGICVPVFKEKYCSAPKSLANAFVSHSGPYKVGDLVSYECIYGFEMVGISWTTCTDNTKWSDDNDPFGCEDIDECSDNSACDVNADCKNLNGSFICTCKSGFEGNGTVCQDIDECLDNSTCDVNADCKNLNGSFNCSCKSGFEGNGTVCQDTNECLNTSTCDDNAVCDNLVGSYNCTCKLDFVGDGKVCKVQFYFGPVKKTKSDAIRACSSDGASLVELTTSSKRAKIKTFMEKIGRTETHVSHYRTSGYSNYNFHHPNGNSITGWCPLEPCCFSEGCVYYCKYSSTLSWWCNGFDHSQYGFHQYSCSMKTWYICENS